MPAADIWIDTRHAERSNLFMLLMAKHTGDIDSQIAHAMSSMEKEDIEAVKHQFEEWKKTLKPAKTTKK